MDQRLMQAIGLTGENSINTRKRSTLPRCAAASLGSVDCCQTHVVQLKSEVTLVEKQDYALLKTENERLLSDVEKLKQRLREEISKTSAGVRLDLNLEKGRIRDELNNRELRIREVDTRIEVRRPALAASLVSDELLKCTDGDLQPTGHDGDRQVQHSAVHCRHAHRFRRLAPR